MTAIVRPAAQADVPAITTIYNQAIDLGNATADMTHVSESERSAWLSRHDPQLHPVWVAEANDVVAGYCSISAYREGREALAGTREISYFVDADHRRQGIGSTLVEHAIQASPALGIHTLFAILLDTNPGSVALLEKHGFERWGHLPDVADFDGKPAGHLYYGLRVG